MTKEIEVVVGLGYWKGKNDLDFDLCIYDHKHQYELIIEALDTLTKTERHHLSSVFEQELARRESWEKSKD